MYDKKVQVMFDHIWQEIGVTFSNTPSNYSPPPLPYMGMHPINLWDLSKIPQIFHKIR